MKAKEVPEKIYLEAIYPDNGVLPNGLNYTPSPTDIEYIRIDAFVEKAVEWLKSHSENDYVEYHMGVTIMHKDKFINDFIDAIERV